MGITSKGAVILKAGRPDESDMGAINAQSLEPLTADEVFSFRVAMCDTRVDRDFERFDRAALEQAARLFVGKTVVKDHDHRADNQLGRIYAAEVVDLDGYSQLVGSVYMLDTPANADVIAAIKGGIRREVSVGLSVSSAVCSVCGRDNAADGYCRHWPGREYDGQTCTFTLGGVTDAYELSFVAVPAQRGAGVIKAYRPEPFEPGEDGAQGGPGGAVDAAAAMIGLNDLWLRAAAAR